MSLGNLSEERIARIIEAFKPLWKEKNQMEIARAEARLKKAEREYIEALNEYNEARQNLKGLKIHE